MDDFLVQIYLTVAKPSSRVVQVRPKHLTGGRVDARPPRATPTKRKEKMSLGSELKRLRIKENKSLQDVADAVKASKAHIWDIERGASKNPTMDLLDRLATHFGVSVGSLVGEEPPTDMHDELVAIYRDLKNLSDKDRETIRNLTRSLGEKKQGNN